MKTGKTRGQTVKEYVLAVVVTLALLGVFLVIGKGSVGNVYRALFSETPQKQAL